MDCEKSMGSVLRGERAASGASSAIGRLRGTGDCPVARYSGATGQPSSPWSGQGRARFRRHLYRSPSGQLDTFSCASTLGVPQRPCFDPSFRGKSISRARKRSWAVAQGAMALAWLALGSCSGPRPGPWEAAGQRAAGPPATQRFAGRLEGPGLSGPFVLDLSPSGAWHLELPDRSETSDGARVRVQPKQGAPSWLGLTAALRRQAELELGFGGWRGPASSWRMRADGRGGLELMRGWTGPQATLEEDQERAEVGEGRSVLRFRSGPDGTRALMSLSRPAAQERWTDLRPLPAGEEAGLLLRPFEAPAAAEPSAAAAVVVPLEHSPKGYFLVRPRLDGRDVGPFLFDTAASASCIDRAAGGRLDWPDLGEIRIQGVGGSGSGRWRRSGLVELGPLPRRGSPWIEVDLAGLEAFRHTVLGGLIGADWLRGHVVVLDPGRHRLVFHDAASPIHTDWPWQPLLVEGGAPCVELRCAPSGSGWFRLDTGSNDTVTLQSPAHRRALYPVRGEFLELDAMRLGGIGGAASARRGELPWIELGTQRFTDVPASFVTSTDGPLAGSALLGTLGTGLLRRLVIAIDMDRQRIAFLPRLAQGGESRPGTLESR